MIEPLPEFMNDGSVEYFNRIAINELITAVNKLAGEVQLIAAKTNTDLLPKVTMEDVLIEELKSQCEHKWAKFRPDNASNKSDGYYCSLCGLEKP